jgi:hypothetical protein
METKELRKLEIKMVKIKINLEGHSFAYSRVVGNVGKELIRTLLEVADTRYIHSVMNLILLTSKI